ncbi:hypothetical protein Dsin_014121 [Dipteronia sinensis]|uniref:Uncharacterized protein n=1 Tax=Dipteronia sinensis TaxID=43782 RepID=A0AAE0AL51_9ROSI|nr:hypothetical protein Dsin_014121 [Dipteronia sinensis]
MDHQDASGENELVQHVGSCISQKIKKLMDEESAYSMPQENGITKLSGGAKRDIVVAPNSQLKPSEAAVMKYCIVKEKYANGNIMLKAYMEDL